MVCSFFNRIAKRNPLLPGRRGFCNGLFEHDIFCAEHIAQRVKQRLRRAHLKFFGSAQFCASTFDVQNHAAFAGRTGEQRLHQFDGAVRWQTQIERLSRKNGQVWLLPENPDYDPIDGSEAELIGIVKAVVREY